jgi:acetyl-CoA acetyltransferase
MWTRRYMHEYGISEEAMSDYLAEVCIRQRRYASTNPNAVMRDVPLDRDGYLNSRMIAEPLRLFDICLETDGACAMVLVSAERARDLPNKPVYIMSADQSLAPWYGNNFNFYRDDFGRLAPRTSSERLFGRAGVKPSDIDMAAVYEASSYQVLATLETTGFCEWGEGGEFYKSGSLPINPHGGHLSEAYIHGQNHFNEAVRQLRGTAANQVDGAEIALVTNAGWSSAILRN